MSSVNDASSFGKPFKWIITKQLFGLWDFRCLVYDFLDVLWLLGIGDMCWMVKMFNLQNCRATHSDFQPQDRAGFICKWYTKHIHVCSANALWMMLHLRWKKYFREELWSTWCATFAGTAKVEYLTGRWHLHIQIFVCFCFRFPVFKLIYYF